MKDQQKSVSKFSKLQNISKLLIKRLSVRAQELGLPKDDLFFLTSIQYIKTLRDRYLLSLEINEQFSMKDFVQEITREILSLTIAIEDFSFA